MKLIVERIFFRYKWYSQLIPTHYEIESCTFVMSPNTSFLFAFASWHIYCFGFEFFMLIRGFFAYSSFCVLSVWVCFVRLQYVVTPKETDMARMLPFFQRDRSIHMEIKDGETENEKRARDKKGERGGERVVER